MRTIEPTPAPLGYRLPRLARRRPRAYEEWSALRRWGLLPDQEATVVGYVLREAREAAAMTQADLAARLGCTQQAVSQAERWLSNPTIDFVRRWAAAAGADLELSLPRARARRTAARNGRRRARGDAELSADVKGPHLARPRWSSGERKP